MEKESVIKSMKQKKIVITGIMIFLLLCLSGCGEQISDQVKKEAQGFLTEHGEDIINTVYGGLDAIQEYGVVGRKHYFENEAEAKSYLLDSLKERYGIQFMVVEPRSYDQYGPIYGDVYAAEIAPTHSPEQIFVGRAMQAGTISDSYWEILFRDIMRKELEEPLWTICEGKEYIQSFSTEVGGSYTERAWRADDALEDVIAEANVDISMAVILEQGKPEEEYADMILDFLEDLYLSGRKVPVYLNFRSGKKGAWIFFRTISEDEQNCPLSREELIEVIRDNKSISPFE